MDEEEELLYDMDKQYSGLLTDDGGDAYGDD